MKEIQHNKYSLFFLENYKQTDNVIGQPLLYISTYTTLEEAQSAQKEFKNKTLILPSF